MVDSALVMHNSIANIALSTCNLVLECLLLLCRPPLSKSCSSGRGGMMKACALTI